MAPSWARPNGAQLTDAEYALNSDGGGGGFLANGTPLGFALQTAEKTFQSLSISRSATRAAIPAVRGQTMPSMNWRTALKKLEAHRFQPMLNETTRGYFTAPRDAGGRQRAGQGDPRLAGQRARRQRRPTRSKPMSWRSGLTRTRCVATRLLGGHADNALPQLATATINCRIIPGVDPNAIRDELQRVVADPEVAVTRNDQYVASLASPLRPDVTNAYTKAVQTLHPGMPIFPEMSTGASDARPFRVAGIPVYGTNGGWVVVPVDFRAHGKDERLPVQSLYDNVVHWELMLRDLAGK